MGARGRIWRMATEPARRVRQSQMEIGRTPPAGLVMQTRRAHPSRLATRGEHSPRLREETHEKMASAPVSEEWQMWAISSNEVPRTPTARSLGG